MSKPKAREGYKMVPGSRFGVKDEWISVPVSDIEQMMADQEEDEEEISAEEKSVELGNQIEDRFHSDLMIIAQNMLTFNDSVAPAKVTDFQWTMEFGDKKVSISVYQEEVA